VNAGDKYTVMSLEKDNREIGYGLVHKTNGNIMQIGIAPERRNRETVAACINGLAGRTSGPVMKYLNVEEGSEMDRLLRELGQKRIVGQYEMVYEIN
jgi:hypothetical protein